MSNVPKHYDLPIQPTEYIVKNGLGWHEGNVIKYVTRWNHKNGLDDLLKAKDYIEQLIELKSPVDIEKMIEELT